MADPKHSPRTQGNPETPVVTSYIRPHPSTEIGIPPNTPLFSASDAALSPSSDVETFLEDWAMRHFTISVKLHDVGRMSAGDVERELVLEDLSVAQGILLELHELAAGDERVHEMMRRSPVLQNGVAALYGWLEEVLEAASRARVTRGKPSFVDGTEAALGAILRTLERVHPDLELLVREGVLDVEPDVAKKIALCFRQVGAVVVRVSGRPGSSIPPSL
jgi:hypothetical protein